MQTIIEKIRNNIDLDEEELKSLVDQVSCYQGFTFHKGTYHGENFHVKVLLNYFVLGEKFLCIESHQKVEITNYYKCQPKGASKEEYEKAKRMITFREHEEANRETKEEYEARMKRCDRLGEMIKAIQKNAYDEEVRRERCNF